MGVDVSVIVPVFNAGHFLILCIESLIHQTLKTSEFIFVDDGSTDGSSEIIESYAKNDSRIKLLKQNHLFAGTARNSGLKMAKGKYVIFLDSDDYFDRNLLFRSFKRAENTKAEVLVFGYQMFDSDTMKKKSIYIPNIPSTPFSINDCDDLFSRCYTMPWNKLFLKEFIVKNEIYFSNIKKSNDVYFVILSLSLANTIVGLRKNLVYYRQNNKFSIQGNKNSNVNCAIDSRIEIKKELVRRGLFDGNIKTSFYKNANLLDYVFNVITDKNAMESYYNYFKSQCVPHIFETEELIVNPLLKKCYFSKSFSDFIFELYKNECNRYNKYRLIDGAVARLIIKMFRMTFGRRKMH